MALAYVTPGSPLRGDTALRADILAGLDAANTAAYHAGQRPHGNWWDWQIGTPQALLDTCVLIAPPAELLDRVLAAVDHFLPDPRELYPHRRVEESTGANRVDQCQVVAVRGVLGRSAAKLAAARDALPAAFSRVTEGDGFHADGSFLQHRTVAYTGSYGVGLLGGAARLLALLAGSPWQVDDPALDLLFDTVERSYLPLLWAGRMLDCVRGRAVVRPWTTDRDAGNDCLEALLRLAEVAPAAYAARWRAAVKGWLVRDPDGSFFVTPSIGRVAAGRALLRSAVSPAAEATGHVQFPAMARVVHRRPGWAYAIAMADRRIAYYECGNGENERGFHTGDGMTYLYTDADPGQFTEGFWPAVDPYRLPGTTVDTTPLPDRAGGEWGDARPDTAPAVMASRGDIGVVGMDLQGPLSTLRARKAWFCLPDRVVALGAGIRCASGRPVETVVENRRASGFSAGPGWVHLSGVAGYRYTGEVRIERTDWVTVWFDHGTDPSDATYHYEVLPGATAERTAADPGVEVVANTPTVQAIRHGRLLLAVFHAAGEVAGLRSAGRRAVIR
jgi:hyaluronate lyase